MKVISLPPNIFHVFCFLAFLVAVRFAAAGQPVSVPAAEWAEGKEGQPAVSGPWGLYQVWPDQESVWENYHPLTWQKSSWGASEHTHGEAPSVVVKEGALVFRVSGPWGVNQPGRKISALVFTAPASGIYRFKGSLRVKRTGDWPASMNFLLFDPESNESVAAAITKAAPAKGQKIEPKPDKARNLFSFLFRLQQAPQPTLLDREVFLPANARLAMAPVIGDNNRAEFTLENLGVTFSPAVTAPADFVENLKPLPPQPPATDETPPKVVVEGEQVVYPEDSNVTDVTKPPYNAKGDGIHDDTQALQRALNEGRIIYLPNGVYLVSDQLRYPRGAKVPSRRLLIGQSRKGAIIKLKDRTMDFGAPKEPLSVIFTSHFPPQAFRIYLKNLTIDTGKGNPGAIGCRFYANNIGAIMDVTIRSGDGSGVIGLDLGYDSDQGPMLARNVRVEGFDVGISTARQTTVTTLEHIEVEGQNVCGWKNDLHSIAVRGFSSKNNVPALISPDAGGFVAMIDVELTGTGPEAARIPAIENAGGMFLRNVKMSGYASVVKSVIGKEPKEEIVPGPVIDEWTSHPVATLFPDTPKHSLNLPVKESPHMTWDKLEDWVSVRSFGSVIVDTGNTYRGKAVTYEDWSEAFRKALAAGKPTVYFPKGEYQVSGTFTIPANVKRLAGLESSFVREKPTAILEVGDGTDPLFIEGWDWQYSRVQIKHTGNRPVVLRNLSGSSYRPEPGAGDVFLDDCCQGGMRFAKGQHVWMRQANPEYGTRPHILNDGADLWILGLKTEGYTTVIVTRNGGRTELIGGCVYANEGQDAEPAFITADGSALSASTAEWVLRSCNFTEWFVEQRGDDVRILRDTDLPKRGYDRDAKPIGGYATSTMIPLYNGYKPELAGDKSKPVK